jgi:hypothetical protein
MVAAQLDDYDVALELAPRSIQDIRWSHDPPQLAAVLCIVARGVVDRDPDAAAVIQGAARTLAPVAITTGSGSSATNEAGHLHTGGLIVEILRETSRRLLDTLGEERLSELRERGTRMDIEEAVAYTLAHLDT